MIEKGWDWKHKAEEYRQFFCNVIQEEVLFKDVAEGEPAPPGNHLIHVLQTQNRLLRELEIGDAVLIYDLGVEIANLKNEKQLLLTELEDIRASEIYAVLEFVKGNKVMQSMIGFYNRLRKRKP